VLWCELAKLYSKNFISFPIANYISRYTWSFLSLSLSLSIHSQEQGTDQFSRVFCTACPNSQYQQGPWFFCWHSLLKATTAMAFFFNWLYLSLKGDSDTWKDTKFIWLHIFKARVHPAPSKCTMQDGWCGWTENTFSLYSSPITNHGGSTNHGGWLWTNHGS
jgi:hypothetical protein